VVSQPTHDISRRRRPVFRAAAIVFIERPTRAGPPRLSERNCPRSESMSKIRIELTSVDNNQTCVVEVVDNPWYRIDLPNDHWEVVSGKLPGVTATSGPWARFASLLNLITMARLEQFPGTIKVGDNGAGLSAGNGAVTWEVVALVP
jgi:hypothetical protein